METNGERDLKVKSLRYVNVIFGRNVEAPSLSLLVLNIQKA